MSFGNTCSTSSPAIVKLYVSAVSMRDIQDSMYILCRVQIFNDTAPSG